MVLSNPPYVASSEMVTLAPDARDYEPHLALDGGLNGTQVIERLVPQAAERLNPGVVADGSRGRECGAGGEYCQGERGIRT